MPSLRDERLSFRRPVVSRIQAVRSCGAAEAAGFHPDGKWLGAPPTSMQAVMA